MSAVLKDEFAAAREQVWSMPLESIDVSDPEVHKNDTVGLYFDRLRAEAPVHLAQTETVWEVLVRNPLQRHYGGGHQSRRFLV